MVFPGVLRGLPGPRLATTPAKRPRRSLSSPGCPTASSLPTLGGDRAGRRVLRTMSASERLNERDAVPSHLGCSPSRCVPKDTARLQSGGPRNPLASLSAARFRVEGQLMKAPNGGQGAAGGDAANTEDFPVAEPWIPPGERGVGPRTLGSAGSGHPWRAHLAAGTARRRPPGYERDTARATARRRP
jgi:hypothetical protein